jgi:hypothetical protein
VHRWPNDGRAELSGPCGGLGQACVAPDDWVGIPVETDLPQSFDRTVDPEDPNVTVRVYGQDDDWPWIDEAEESFTFAVPLDIVRRRAGRFRSRTPETISS